MRCFFQKSQTFYSTVILIATLFTTFTYAQQMSNPTQTDPCAIPQNTDIIHFPIESWDSFSELAKTAEETFYTVAEGLNNFVKFFEKHLDIESGNSDNNTEQSTESKLPDVLEKAAYLQFALARLIQQKPNSLIFHEFTTQIYDTRYLNNLVPWVTNTISQPEHLPDLKNRRPEHLYYLVREQFPHGLPIQYKYLDKDQKYTLAITGGVHTLFFMDQLPFIFPSISNADYQRLNINEEESFNYCDSYYSGLFKICTSSYYMLQVFRAEKLASIVNNLLNISSSFQQEKPIAILAYRDTHDLSQYFTDKKFYKLPSSCIQPKAE